ncbi:MAG: ATP-binding protein, partial [Oscillospiraceae bacterium]
NIYLTANIYEDRTLCVKIRDRGIGIENISLAMTPLYTTAPQEDRAGLGFAVMQTFMDKVTVSSKQGKGTTVTLTKKLSLKKNI